MKPAIVNYATCFCFLFFISVVGCNAQGKSTGENFSLTLLLKNPTGRQIIADIEPITLSPKSGTRAQRKIVLDNNNNGILKLRLNGPSVLKLMNAYPDSSISYIAIPGVDMIVHLDTRREDTTHYHDLGPAETEFYNTITEKGRELLKQIPQQDPNEFLKDWARRLDALEDSVNAAMAAGMAPAYANWISQSLRSLFQTTLSRQLVNYATIKQVWPANMKDYVNKVPEFTDAQLNQPASFSRETDKELMESYFLFHSLIDRYKKGLPVPGIEDNYRNAINEVNKMKAEGPRNIMLRYLVTSLALNTTDTAILQWMKRAVVFNTGNEHLRKMIGDKLALLRTLGFNNPAPYFDARDAAGNKFSYSNYRGKYLFIDIWATWCVPCRKEIPYLEALKERYAGEPIEFISISTDQDRAAWRKFLALTGGKDQFHSSPAAPSSIREAYRATLIPAFVLVDPQGKIINPATLRPSDPALGLLLDQLLQKNNTHVTQ